MSERRHLPIDDVKYSEDPVYIEPLAHVEDLGDRYLISLDLPLVDKKDVEVSASETDVEISARICRSYCFDGLGFYCRGFEAKSFRKNIKLPEEVDTEAAKARFIRGVLEVELPKKTGRRRLRVE